jgi:hypothetical protein
MLMTRKRNLTVVSSPTSETLPTFRRTHVPSYPLLSTGIMAFGIGKAAVKSISHVIGSDKPHVGINFTYSALLQR